MKSQQNLMVSLIRIGRDRRAGINRKRRVSQGTARIRGVLECVGCMVVGVAAGGPRWLALAAAVTLGVLAHSVSGSATEGNTASMVSFGADTASFNEGESTTVTISVTPALTADAVIYVRMSGEIDAVGEVAGASADELSSDAMTRLLTVAVWPSMNSVALTIAEALCQCRQKRASREQPTQQRLNGANMESQNSGREAATMTPGTLATEAPPALPPIQLIKHVATGANIDGRSAPYWVRGRDHETAHIISTLTGMPCAISLIAGSPGSGKSSLLRHIEMYMRSCNRGIVELKNDSFQNEITLRDALLQKVLPTALPDTTTEGHGSTVEGGLIVVKGGVEDTRTATTSHRRPRAWRDALDLLGEGRGTLIIMDEMQRLEEVQEDPDQRKLAGEFFDELHAKHMGRPDRRVALVGSGLTHTREVLNRFHMSRIEAQHVIRLGPMSGSAVHQVLIDHCTAPDVRGQTLIQPPAELLAELVQASGGCPHHLAWAGCQLQQAAIRLRQQGATEWDEPSSIWVLGQNQLSRHGLYDKRLPAEGPARQLGLTLATATATWGEALPENLVMALADHFRRGNGDEDPLQVLTEKGVIERRSNADQFLTAARAIGEDGQNRELPTHYTFPIHSMATWARTSVQQAPGAAWTEAESERAIAAAIEAASTDISGVRIEPWAWDYAQPLAPAVTEMPLPEAGVDATDRNAPRKLRRRKS